jgi:hypothetical protein
MKNSMSPNEAKGLTASMESMRGLKPDELAERWRSLFGSDPPARLRRPLLIQAFAYRSQEKAFGGVAGDTGARRSIALQPRRSVTAGAVLVREWHGATYQVTALNDGFMFSGKHFQSLSKIAYEITGTRWSGPLFFGLKNSRQERRNGVH